MVARGLWLLICGALALNPVAAWSQDWPSKPIRIIVPYAAGGNTDVVARLTAERLQNALGQSVTVENRAGAAGMVAVNYVVNAAPDGYTLLMSSTGPHTIVPSLKANVAFDPVNDLAPVSNVASNALVLLVHPSLPVTTYRELIELAQREPGKLNIGSGGVGSTAHLAGEMLKSMAKIDMVHVPFPGGAPLMVSALAGNVQVSFNNMADALPMIRSGKLRGLAVTSAVRQPQAPEIPTLQELGLPDYECGPWNGLVAPSKTPPAIIERLATEVQKLVKEPAFQARLTDIGSVPIGDTPAQFSMTIKQELGRWKKLSQESGVRIE
jgi:tripartite-type tricarboxylate transporter receptor subunit TctC